MSRPSDQSPDDQDALEHREAGPDDAAAPLLKSREAAGLTREEVATQLNLSVETIEALETGAYDRLPPPTFVRGYLRGYARLLHLDTDRLLQMYDASRPNELPQITSVSKVVAQPGSGHPIMRWATVLIVLGLVGMAALWWNREYRDPAPIAEADGAGSVAPVAESNSAAGSLPGSTSGSAAEPMAMITPSADRTDEPTPAPSLAEPAAAPQAAPEVAPAIDPAAPTAADPRPVDPSGSQTARAEPAPVQPAPSRVATEPARAPATVAGSEGGGAEVVAADVLMARAEGESWMEVHDAEDRQLYFDLLRAGTPARLEGTAPFRIFLGNAPAVSLRINGVAVDQAAFIRSNNTARFVVDKDGARRR